jgi:segregation and condensation protein A
MIQKLGTGTIALSDLLTDDRRENISRFVAVLHLVRDGKINIWQEELPYGSIYIEIKMDWATGSIETLPSEDIATLKTVV